MSSSVIISKHQDTVDGRNPAQVRDRKNLVNDRIFAILTGVGCLPSSPLQAEADCSRLQCASGKPFPEFFLSLITSGKCSRWYKLCYINDESKV